MRKAWLAAALLLISSGAFAAPSEEDKLFAQLHDGSPPVDLLMTRAKAALGGTANDVARKLLDSVTQVAPNYAEGWRARAALQAAGNDDAGAMVSLQKAVTLNTRQFEAM